VKDLLKPYYDDDNYLSNPSEKDEKKIRSKTPAQLLSKFDPLPSSEMQEKINFFYKPYALELSTKKHMNFSLNERDEYLFTLRKQLLNP